MTRSELIRRVKWRLSAKPMRGMTQEQIERAIAKVMEPLDARDSRAAERNIKPYEYQPQAPAWLEREVRRELASGV